MTAANNNLGGSISGVSSESDGVLTLTLNGQATAARYEQALQSITYEDSSANPTAGSRSLTLAVADSQLNSASAGYTINVLGANSSLAIVAPASESLDQDGSMMFAWSAGDPISLADPNIGTGNDSMTLSVTNGSLDLGSSAGLATSSGNGTAIINISGQLAALDAALDGLEYFPGADYVNSDPLSVSITDSTGQKATANVTLSISPTAPAPSFSPGPDQIVPVGASTQTIPGWASGITAGPPDDSSATLIFLVSVVNENNPNLFTTAPAIDPEGDLTYAPAAGQSGTATISVELEATPTSGGAAVDSDASAFTIRVGAITPQLVVPSSELMPENGVLVLGSSGTGGIYVDGDTDTSAQVTVTVTTNWGTFDYTDTSGNAYSGDTTATLSGTITNVNVALATLILEPTSNSSGTGIITVSLSSGATVYASDPIQLAIVESAATSPDISVSLPTGQGAPENQWYTFSGDTGNPILINADPSAEAVVTIAASNGYLSLGSTDDSGDSFATLSGTVAEINTELDGLGFSPINFGTAQLTVTAMSLDQSGNPVGEASASTDIDVRQAPYFNAYQPLWLQDEPQWTDAYTANWGDNPVVGTQLIQLLNLSYSAIGTEDVDAYGSWGIAITGLDTQNGTWQYALDNGTSVWQTIDAGELSDSNALLLDSSYSLRFVPNAKFFGDITDAVTFRLWDETSGTDTTYADVSDNGGVTAFSADTATAALRVDPLVSISGSGGNYTISTASDVPWDLDVSGTAGWTNSTPLPFTVVIPANSSSTTLDLSNFAGLGLAGDYGVGYSTTFTVSLVPPGTGAYYYGDPMSSTYDYAVDPTAGSVSTTETATTNTGGPGGQISFPPIQNGNTIQLTLGNPSATIAMNWFTVDGTADGGTAGAGKDYESAGGSIPGGGSQTVTITLDNLDAPGDSGFFIATTGGGYSGTTYIPLTIRTAQLQLLADSNNDGRIDAEADATANTADVASGSGGVFEFTDDGSASDPSSSRQALIASDMLVEVQLAFNRVTGESIKLSAPGDTGNLEVFASPDSTTQINVDGDGTTWTSDSAPDAVWIAARAAGDETLVAQVVGPGAQGVPAQAVAIQAQSVWQTAINYTKTQTVAGNPAPTYLLQWNNTNKTPVQVGTAVGFNAGIVTILPTELTTLSRYAAGQIAPQAQLTVQAPVRSLNNEGFSAWFAAAGSTTWVGTVARAQTQYVTTKIGGWLIFGGTIYTTENLAEEAMSNVVDENSFDKPDPYVSASLSSTLTPGHGGAGGLLNGVPNTNKPLTELGYLTALWVLYNGPQNPGVNAAGSQLPALQAWFAKMFP